MQTHQTADQIIQDFKAAEADFRAAQTEEQARDAITRMHAAIAAGDAYDAALEAINNPFNKLAA